MGQQVFQGTHPLQNQGHSLSPSLTTTESRSDRSKEKWSYGNDITTKSRTCILHLTSLYKIKNPYMLGKRGFRGTILYRIKVIPSHHPSPLQNQDLKISHWWACSDYKIKDLRTSPAVFLQNQFLTQNVRFCALPAECWGPCLYMSTYQDTVQKWSKLVVLGWLPAHGPWFCSTVGFQTGSPESKVFGVPTPSIL